MSSILKERGSILNPSYRGRVLMQNNSFKGFYRSILKPFGTWKHSIQTPPPFSHPTPSRLLSSSSNLLFEQQRVGKKCTLTQHAGFTLLEMLLVLGGVTVLGTGALITYKVVQSRQSTTTAVEGSRFMARSLMQTYGETGSFQGVSSTSLINGNLIPKNMAVKGTTINNSWGGTVQIAPVGAANNAFALTWNKVPSDACANMATQLSPDFMKIEVNGVTVKDEDTAINANQTASLCGGTDNNTLALTSPDVAIPQSGEPPDPTDFTASSLPVSAPAPVAAITPVGMAFSSFTNLAPPPPPTPTAPSVVSVTAVQMSVPDTVYTGDGVAPDTTQYDPCSNRLSTAAWQPNPQTATQTIPGSAECPTGYLGSDTWTQQQTKSRSATCIVPAAQSDPVWSGWSAWADTGGKIGESNTCNASCATQLASPTWQPNPGSKTQNIPGSAACPAGMTGSDTWTQQQTATRTATCANPAATPVWGAYSAWVNTGGKIGESNTCASTCSTQLATATWQPNPQTDNQTIAGSAACPAGYTGSDTWTQAQVRSRTATCAIPSGTAAPTWSAWSAWTDTGGKIGEVNNCAVSCATQLASAPWQPNPQTENQTIAGSASCPAGYTGADTWQQAQTRSRTASCVLGPSGVTAPAWGAWSAWSDTGGKIGESNTCTASCATQLASPAWQPNPETGTQTIAGSAACAAGYVGSDTWTQNQTRSRTASCPVGVTAPVWGAWSAWVNSGGKIGEVNNCTASCATQLASATWQPNPETGTQTIAGSAACAAGYVGSDTWTQNQTRSRTATCAIPGGTAAPTWGAWSAWVNSGGKIGESNTCAASCATQLASATWKPNPQTGTQTIGGSAACPAGYTGSDTWTQNQTRSRTATCAVPGSTAAPTWGAWSAWVNSGGKIGEVNTCAIACAPASGAGSPVVTEILLCVGQTSTIGGGSFSGTAPSVTTTPTYPQIVGGKHILDCVTGATSINVNGNGNSTGLALATFFYRIKTTWNGNTYTAMSTCQAHQSSSGETCSVGPAQNYTGSMPPGIQMSTGGLFLARQSGNNQGGAPGGYSAKACP